jgi:hypothetical protein
MRRSGSRSFKAIHSQVLQRPPAYRLSFLLSPEGLFQRRKQPEIHIHRLEFFPWRSGNVPDQAADPGRYRRDEAFFRANLAALIPREGPWPWIPRTFAGDLPGKPSDLS